MRPTLSILIAALLLMAPSPAAHPGGLAVSLRPLALDPSDPARRRIGRLVYLGGWELRSNHPDFGGFSALAVAGDRFRLLSDTGTLVRFRLKSGRALDASLVVLPGLAGLPKKERDTESMALDAKSGTVWVGFEQRNEIRRYGPNLATQTAAAAPPAMARWPGNGGAEAMTILADSRFLVLSEEGGSSSGLRDALLFAGDPTGPATPPPISFRYRPPEGHVPTDAALLPDGRVIVLNRRYSVLSGVSAVVTIVDPRTIADGGVLGGEEVARLQPPLTVDNMEGIAVTREAGRTILWMASDDNFAAVQRNLLLKFALAPR